MSFGKPPESVPSRDRRLVPKRLLNGEPRSKAETEGFGSLVARMKSLRVPDGQNKEIGPPGKGRDLDGCRLASQWPRHTDPSLATQSLPLMVLESGHPYRAARGLWTHS